jgi:hypothetical protein
MKVTIPDNLSFTGVDNGDVIPSAFWFQLENIGDEVVQWGTATSSSNNWLSITGGAFGSLAPGMTTNIAITADYNVGGLEVGNVYAGVLSFFSQENPIAELVNIYLSYEDSMKVIPEQQTFMFNKINALTYAPETYEVTITNRAAISIDWQAYGDDTNGYVDLSALSGTLSAYQSEMVTVSPKPAAIALPDAIYTETLTFSNLTSAVGLDKEFVVRNTADYFTQLFSSGGESLSNTSLFFVQNSDNTNYYLAFYNSDIDQFFVDPYSGTSVELTDDGIADIDIVNSDGIDFYGDNYTNIFINGNGRVTFGFGSSVYNPTYSNHFAIASVAPMFGDLSPQDGEVYYEEFLDRLVISYINVPEYGTENYNSFQIEFFFNGNIRVTYGDVSIAGDFICGISKGSGIPSGFVESDMAIYLEYQYDSLFISPEVGYSLFARKNIALEQKMYAFSISNTLDVSVNWSAAASEDWLTMIPAFGMIEPGGGTIITARVESVVNSFDLGRYINYIEFTDVDSGQKQGSYVLFEMQEGVGQVEITGSLPAINEQAMPFGNQQIGVGCTECLYVKNTDTQYPIKIENIRLNKTSVPVYAGFTMTNKTVLLYADDYLHGATASYPYQVLTAMGATVTVYGAEQIALFYDALISRQWDMVVFSSEYYYVPNYAGVVNLENALVDFAKSGKPIIAGSWCATYWGSKLWQAIGADVSSMTMIQEPVDIVGLDDSEMFFEQPLSVPNPLEYSFSYFNYYGCAAKAYDQEFAIPIATFSIESDYSLLYMENSIYKGYLDCEFDETTGIKDLWYNMIYNINANSFAKQLNYQNLLPITINPAETYEIPINFLPRAFDAYESELFIAFDALNVSNVSIDVTGFCVASTNITMGYSRWRDQYGDHLMITNNIDVGDVTSASVGEFEVKDIVTNPVNNSIEFVFDEINTTNLLDVVYQARSGEYVISNLFSYYSEYVYVSPSGLEINGFNSWANASKTIQEAVNEADEWALVLVNPGIYTASAGSRVFGESTASVTNVVVLNKNIVLRGVNTPIIHGEDINRPVLLLDGVVIENMYIMNGQTKTGLNYFMENNGGGIWAESEAAVVNNLTIWNCHAGYFGGGVFGATVRNSFVENCSAYYGGGLGYVNAETDVDVLLCSAEYGGAIANSFFTDGSMDSNSALFGGAATDSDIFASTLAHNQAVYGGAIFGNSNPAVVVNTLLHDNAATGNGGAFYQNPYASPQTSFINCTVVDNRRGSDSCGGILNADVRNSIVYGNTGNDIQGSSEIYYSNIGTGTVPANQGNILTDPLFSTNSCYELSLSSPCIDHGSNEYVTSDSDLAGNNRIAHGAVDMGAYELPWYVIMAAAQGPGIIAPLGTIDVPKGTNILFTATPDEHYQLAGFTTNGCPVTSAASTFDWQNISASGTIMATFNDIIITNGMSEMWLAEFYPGATNYNELANMDTDGDGLVSWQEFVALTVPTNEQSVFQTFITATSDDIAISWLPFDDSLRTYSVDATTNLWTPFNTISNELKNGSMTISTNKFLRFFKAKVQQ